MFAYLKTWLGLKTDRRGVTALEYALIAALIAGGVITAAIALSGNISTTFNKMGTALTAAKNGVQ